MGDGMQTLGKALFVIAVIVSFIGRMALLSAASDVSGSWRLLLRFFPPATILFAIFHWAEAKVAFFIQLAGLGLFALGAYFYIYPDYKQAKAHVEEAMAKAEAREARIAANQSAPTEDVWADENAEGSDGPRLPIDLGEGAPAPQAAAVPASSDAGSAEADPALSAFADQTVGELVNMYDPPPPMYAMSGSVKIVASQGELSYHVGAYKSQGLTAAQAAQKIKERFDQGLPGDSAPAAQPPPQTAAAPAQPAPAAAPASALPVQAPAPARVDPAKLAFDLKPGDMLIEEARKKWDKGDKAGAVVHAEKALRIYTRLLPPEDPRVINTQEMIKAAKSQTGS